MTNSPEVSTIYIKILFRKGEKNISFFKLILIKQFRQSGQNIEMAIDRITTTLKPDWKSTVNDILLIEAL